MVTALYVTPHAAKWGSFDPPDLPGSPQLGITCFFCHRQTLICCQSLSIEWILWNQSSLKIFQNTFRLNLGKCWPIFKILSHLDSALNLHYVLYYVPCRDQHSAENLRKRITRSATVHEKTWIWPFRWSFGALYPSPLTDHHKILMRCCFCPGQYGPIWSAQKIDQ